MQQHSLFVAKETFLAEIKITHENNYLDGISDDNKTKNKKVNF